ncbi:MAG: hypothetical protein LAT57_10275 [Balneolales bacterium]|nr:hypothetical protein [Balneolales bacterium]
MENNRAQKELYFSFARSRYKFGEEKPALRSRFLDEVDPGVVRNENGSTINQRGERNNSRPTGTFIEYDHQKPLNTGYQSPAVKRTRPSYSRPADTAASSAGITYESAETESLKPGVFVMHEKFGPGKVLQREGSGAETKVVVFFQNHGQKKLALKYAKLRIIT